MNYQNNYPIDKSHQNQAKNKKDAKSTAQDTQNYKSQNKNGQKPSYNMQNQARQPDREND